jgi:hypothetical protein
MPTTATSIKYATCQVTQYDMATGYSGLLNPDGTVVDTLKQFTRFYLALAEEAIPGRDPITSAVVDFGDQGPGPVTSLGRVIHETGTLRVEVLLPRDEFEAFWHNLHLPGVTIVMARNESDEVIMFYSFGTERLAPDEHSRRRVDSLRRELSGDTGS